MVNKIKPRIVISLSREDNKIKHMAIKDVVKRVGDSGYIALPSELIGKYVLLNLEVQK